MATAALLTLQQVMALAQVSYVTVHYWRKGTATRSPLPAIRGANTRTVHVSARVFKQWAKEHGVQLTADPMSVARGEVELSQPIVVHKTSINKTSRASKKSAKKSSKSSAALQ